MRKLLFILFSFSISVFGQSTDNFDAYANGASLDAQANWVKVIQDMDVYKPASDGEVHGTEAGWDGLLYYTGTFDADQFSQITYTAGATGGYVGVAVRVSETDNGYLWYGNNSRSYFMKYVGGEYTEIDQGNAWSVSSVYRIEAEGTQIRCYVDGSLDASIDGDGVYTDSDLSSGNPGICSYSDLSTVRGDDWSGGDLTSTPATSGYAHYIPSGPAGAYQQWITTHLGNAYSNYLGSTSDVTPPTPSTSGDYNFALSHNQYMITYDGALDNDVVEKFDPWYVTEDTTSLGAFSYTLIDNEGGIYAINSSTGLITITDNTDLESGIDTLVVTTELGSLSENDSVFVTVHAAANCVFWNPGAATDGAGTRASPKNTIGNVTFQAGKVYLQLRGTEAHEMEGSHGVIVSESGTASNRIVFGGYGPSTTRPSITDVTSTGYAAFKILGDYISIYGYYFNNNSYSIHVDNWPAGDGLTWEYLFLSDIECSNDLTGNGSIYYGNTDGILSTLVYSQNYDIISYGHSTGYGIKFESSYHTLRNFRAYQCQHNFDAATWSTNITAYGISTYRPVTPSGESSKSIELSGSHHELGYFLANANFSGSMGALRIEDNTSHSSYIHNGIAKGGTYFATVSIASESNDLMADFKFENILIDSSISGYGMTIGNYVDSVTITRCEFSNHATYGLYINGTATDSIAVINSVFHDAGKEIYANGATTRLSIDNCTVDGEVDVSNANGEVMRYSLYKVTDVNTTGNVDIDGITTADVFVDYAGNDYHLKATAGASILDAATNSITEEDKDGNPIYNKIRDVGAFEYTP